MGIRRFSAALLFAAGLSAQDTPAVVKVDFTKRLQVWDGFGVNYVEVSQTRDYQANPQEYGGFSGLSESRRREILEMIFGADGLKPGLVKMFLDPFHTTDDHTSTTRWMRYFVNQGLKMTRARGGDLSVITTLYGPPAAMTKQKFLRGRDLDPARKRDLAEYMISWVKFLRQKEGVPVKYVSLHNEGEDFLRWPVDGKSPGYPTHDYNLYWPSAQVVDFVKILRPMLDQAGLNDVGIAPGETTNWFRFVAWGYAPAIANDSEAARKLGLITSHGFTGGANEWFGGHEPAGVDLLRQQRPDLHAWTTSMTWGRMDVNFVDDIRGQIYDVKVNGVIPWAAVQTNKWVGGDPNPGTAFRVIEDCGCYNVLPGYYLYKQVSRAGQPGMAVAAVTSKEVGVRLLAFSANGTANPDSFVVVNLTWNEKPLRIELAGTRASRFSVFRTSLNESYMAAPPVQASAGAALYTAPAKSVTTFFAQ